MSNSMRQLLLRIENNNLMNILENPQERQASNMRMQFFTKYILKKNTNSYKTKTERDYGYIALREYRYLVNQNSVLATGGVTCMASILYSSAIKRTSAIPLVFLSSYFLFRKYYFVKHNKRLFDMCNVGEETELGYQRNQVLRECNELLDREDF